MAGRVPIKDLSVAEIVYLAARSVLALVFGLVYLTGEIWLIAPALRPYLLISCLLSTVTTAIVVVTLVFMRLSAKSILRAAALPDLVGIALAVLATQKIGDPAFVWVIGFAIVYALLLPIGEALLATFGVAIVYLAAYAAASLAGEAGVPWATQVTKAVGVGVLGYFAADAMRRQAKRDAELFSRQQAIEELNERLQHRLEGLTAVTEIAEVIHSSLDFEAMGPQILEMIRTFLGVSGCGIVVMDRTNGDILFGASSDGFELPSGSPPKSIDDADRSARFAGPGNTCLTLLDTERLSVVFCSPAECLDAIGWEERLVLQTVASELAVAAENSRLYKLTKRMSLTDELTGLYNYRYLQQRLLEELDRAVRYDRPISLLMIDVDHFKGFNDREGHLAGDRALAQLGRLFADTIREIDVAGRYGGEEFAIILPESGVDSALVVAEKVREAVSRHVFADSDGEQKLHLTISIGLASFPEHASDLPSLFRQADEALYQAKRLGRNRVCIAPRAPHRERRRPA